MPNPLFAGFPDAQVKLRRVTRSSEEREGAEFEVIKGGNRQHFNVGTVE